MADRYEPKLTVRPLSERKPAASASAESDPLVELTRMVTGRSTFDPAPVGKRNTVPAAVGPATDAVSTLSNDLESELLSELQASFYAVREPVASPPPAAPPAPSPAPATRSAPLAAPAPAAAQRPQPASPPVEKPVARQDLVRPSAPAPRADRPPQAPVAPVVRPAAPSVAPAPASQTLADRQSLFRSGNGPTVDLSHLQMRTTTAPTPEVGASAPPPRQTAVPRWTPPAAAAADVPSRFAPPRSAAAAPETTDEIDVEDELPLTGEEADDDFTLEDLSALPEYGDEGEVPPFPEDELAGLSQRRNNRGLFLIAGVLVVALAGGLAYVMLSGGKSSNSPPIIAADTTPTKVIPDPSTAAVDPAKESDRVDATDSANDTKLNTPGQVDIASIPSGTESTNPISRVIIPGGPGFDTPTADDTSSDPNAPAQIGPKKVRTVVVRPDGTIVSSEASAPGETPAASPPAAAETTTPAAVPAPSAEDTPPAAATAASDSEAAIPPAPQSGMETVLDGQNGNIAVDTDPLAAGKPAAKPVAPAPGTVPAVEAVKPPPAAAVVAAVEPAKEPVPKPEQRPVKPVVVAAKAPAPMDIVPATPAANAARPMGSGVLVQLSSQKSEDAARAAYQGMQRRFPGILGTYSPNIQRADLGDRGVYFRVRVGPFSGADAARLCEDLKAAGGDCIIAH